MYKGIEISASVMCFDWLNAGKQLREIEQNNIDYLHFDVADGRFVKDYTMGTSIIDIFRENSQLKSDYHLMIEEPYNIFDSFKASTNDIITIHQEACRNLHRDIMSLKKLYPMIKIGVALSPATSFESLEYIIEDIDIVLVMMVDPGFKGQPLVPQTIRKIKNLKKIISKMGLNVKISVDGCVNENTTAEMVAAGADILVLGSSGLLKTNCSIQESISKIHKQIDIGLQYKGEI